MNITQTQTDEGLAIWRTFTYGDDPGLVVNAIYAGMKALEPVVPAKPAPIFTAVLASSVLTPPWHNASVKDTNCTIGAVTPAAAGVPKLAGDYVVKAKVSGSSSGYARTHFQHSGADIPNWIEGDEIWYSASFFLPVGYHSRKSTTNDIMRWDAYHGSGFEQQMQGGLGIGTDGNFYIMRNYPYARPLDTDVRAPEGEWFDIEVHQVLSPVDGDALNELYLNGVLVGSSDIANYNVVPYAPPRNEINRLRVGIVSEGGASDDNTLFFDNVAISVAV